MATYVYETIPSDGSAPRRFEVEQGMNEPPLERDPETGLPVRRVITGGQGLIGTAPAPEPPCAGGACGMQEPGLPCGGGACALEE